MGKEIIIRIKIPGGADILEKVRRWLKKIKNNLLMVNWNFLRRIQRDFRDKPLYVAVSTFAATVAFWYLSAGTALLWFCFLLFLLYAWESRIIIASALLLFVMATFLLFIGLETTAETLMFYVYYLLFIFVVLQVVSSRTENQEQIDLVSVVTNNEIDVAEEKNNRKKNKFLAGFVRFIAFGIRLTGKKIRRLLVKK